LTAAFGAGLTGFAAALGVFETGLDGLAAGRDMALGGLGGGVFLATIFGEAAFLGGDFGGDLAAGLGLGAGFLTATFLMGFGFDGIDAEGLAGWDLTADFFAVGVLAAERDGLFEEVGLVFNLLSVGPEQMADEHQPHGF